MSDTQLPPIWGRLKFLLPKFGDTIVDVHVKDKAFWDRRRRKFARKLGIDISLSFGPLIPLWHHSQNEETSYGTKEDIFGWCEFEDDDFGEQVFEALISSGYISTEDGVLYKIHGNDPHVEKLKSLRNRSKKGGAATKAKFEKIKKEAGPKSELGLATQSQTQIRPSPDDCSQDLAITTPNHPNPESIGPNSGLGLATEGQDTTLLGSSTVQFSTVQCSTVHKEKKSKKESSDSNPTSSGKLDANAPGSRSSKSKIPKKWKDQISDFDRSMASTWLTFAREQIPRGKFNEEEFQVAITKMRVDYKLGESEITSLLDWCKDSEFWRNKSYSPVGLLKRKGEKTNLDTILAQKSQQRRNTRSTGINSDRDWEVKRKILAEWMGEGSTS